MEIPVSPSSEKNIQILGGVLGSFQHFSGGIAEDIRESLRSDTLKVGLPLETYTFFPGKNESRIEFTGWRYLLLNGEEVFGTAELSYNRETDKVLFSKFDNGFLGRTIVRGVNFVENLPEFNDQDSKMRLLRIPAYDMAGLWVPSEDDLIVPLRIFGDEVRAFSVFKLNALLAQLKGQSRDLNETRANL